MNIDQVALQLYTVRSHTQEDMLGTLRQVAEIGYCNVELAGYGNASVPEIRSALDQLGVRAISAHTPFGRCQNELDQVIDELQTLGCKYAIVPAVSAEHRDSVDRARALAHELNAIGARVHEAGLRFGYHNHAFEFAPLDGTTFWEVLVRETDPALVSLELDVAWVDVGGHDPADLIRQLGDRVRLIHAKDHQGGAAFVDMPIGDGVLQWPAILGAAEAVGVRYYIVEQDNPRDPLNDVRRSFEALRRLSS
jgi:sugar phosphate isomerase/epimerase